MSANSIFVKQKSLAIRLGFLATNRGNGHYPSIEPENTDD
jgi:hypothetical protein